MAGNWVTNSTNREAVRRPELRKFQVPFGRASLVMPIYLG